MQAAVMTNQDMWRGHEAASACMAEEIRSVTSDASYSKPEPESNPESLLRRLLSGVLLLLQVTT